MIIVIDGYNFLKSVIGTSFITDRQMHDWLMRFKQYVHQKNNKILLVFDAGPSFFASCEKIGEIEVCYAGQHQTADDWIKSWLEKNKQKDILLVSSDREIRSWAQHCGVVSISSQDFYKLFTDALRVQESYKETVSHQVCKTKKDGKDELVDEYLDSLMYTASQDIYLAGDKYQQDEDSDKVIHSKKVSKSDKSLLKKIDKI